MNTLSIIIQEPASNSYISEVKPALNSRKSRLITSWVGGDGTFNPISIGTSQMTVQVHPQLFTKEILLVTVEKYKLNMVMDFPWIFGISIDGSLVDS